MEFALGALCVVIICLTWRTERQKHRMDELEKELFFTQHELEEMRRNK